MLRSITYAVWRGTNNPRWRVKARAATSLAQRLHSSEASTQAAPQDEDADTLQVSDERLSENDVVSPNFVNRNPRNLERMAVAQRDKGWSRSHPRKNYWHKLHFEKSNWHTRAYIQHYNGNVVISASTKEWAIKKHLYSTADVSAAENIGRILAQRCLESGISYVHCEIDSETRSYERVIAFLNALCDGGMVLSEPKPIRNFREPVDYFPEDY
ncbi:39S ribosomal protein L18, mitochondrial-like [Acanthaster planci]|uniref:Large ribosomal subunit protein uL18m n=1 Tax=Acanthaster planci TaxID=133434 RepID=A0A8B7YJE5_ACAPL|nr:39S ribosomal protein L18, mitochondrial-like [Acanthaster planci]